MKKAKEVLKNIWKDESAQGATEYILLLVVVVGLAMIFRNRISGLIQGKIEEVGGLLGSFTAPE
jgi:Flp pilus assembly pilin Flp